MYYKISHGSVTLGNNTVLEDVNFCVKDNEKIGIVGRNGSGKTTLLKAIIGEYEINSGYEEVDIISSGDFNIGYVKQNDGYNLDMKMIDYIRSSFKDILDIEYLFYYCFKLDNFCREHLNQGNFASVDMKAFNTFEFCIPSIEKQKETASILKRFDTLCNDLSEGLPAEIEARRKQYEYYRDKLLSFKELQK